MQIRFGTLKVSFSRERASRRAQRAPGAPPTCDDAPLDSSSASPARTTTSDDVASAAEPAFGLEQVGVINETLLRYVESLHPDELAARCAEVTVLDTTSSGALERAKRVLEEYGIVIFPNVVDRDACSRACDALSEAYARYAAEGEIFFEDDDAVFQDGPGSLKGYQALSTHDKTVITIRHGQDAGMVDIFNCDQLAPMECQPLREAFTRDDVLTLLADKKVLPRNLNVYLNNGVARTRGLHVDSYSGQLKAFVYLTDVTELAAGPYSYVKRSHMDGAFRRANRALTAEIKPGTEAPVVDPLALTPVIGERGALVISDQSGVHRGWPQAKGAFRAVAVMSYKR